MFKNNKGYSIIILLFVFLLIGLAYFVSFKGDKIAVNDILGDADLANEEVENPYLQAIEAAKKVKLLQMRDISEEDYYIGKLDAPVKIIYYSDFECPFCQPYAETLNKVIDEYGDQVVLAFRYFILSNHNLAIESALASECAAEQNDFWGMYNKLYEDNKMQSLNKEEYIKDAEELGLDSVQFSECLEKDKYKNKIFSLVEEAKSYGVTGTPTTYINGKPLSGAYPYEDFTNQIGEKIEGLKTNIERELEL